MKDVDSEINKFNMIAGLGEVKSREILFNLIFGKWDNKVKRSLLKRWVFFRFYAQGSPVLRESHAGF